MPNILYKDKHLLVCEKEPGVLSAPGLDGSPCMTDLVSEQLGGAYVGLVHRLDRGVGGVMLFSLRRELTGKLCAMFGGKTGVKKEYLTVLEGCPEQTDGVLCDLLFHDAATNKTFRADTARKGAKEASLAYRVLSSIQADGGALSLVRVLLHTGRTHQIRAQFSLRGWPVAGDGKYGSRRKCVLALYAARLCFTHPVTGKVLDVRGRLPQADVWNAFLPLDFAETFAQELPDRR